jgi:hypothetical protein
MDRIPAELRENMENFIEGACNWRWGRERKFGARWADAETDI